MRLDATEENAAAASKKEEEQCALQVSFQFVTLAAEELSSHRLLNW